jgi:triacylglycerol lipase
MPRGMLSRGLQALLLITVLGCGEATQPIEPTARQPIVFVHGLGGSAADWSPVLARFRADGWTDRELNAASYSSLVSNASVASAIRDRVDSVLRATGWSQVDIVSYSMGSLSSRYYLKNLGGTARVDAWVSVAGPNHGTETALQCSLTPCLEMRPGSAFLTALNDGDETPGPVRYATWWSPCDETIVPPESAILQGAMNTETACLPHTGMFTETIYLQVRAFIAP